VRDGSYKFWTDPAKSWGGSLQSLGRIVAEFGKYPARVWDGSRQSLGRILAEFGTDPCQEFGTDPAKILGRILRRIWEGYWQSLGRTLRTLSEPVIPLSIGSRHPATVLSRYWLYMFIIWDKSCGYNTLFFIQKLLSMASLFLCCFGCFDISYTA
jgi:hypothetical protein